MIHGLLLVLCVLSLDCLKAESDKDFRVDVLKTHNTLRNIHGTPKMTLSDYLNQFAQKWADTVKGDHILRHSSMTLESGEQIGENLGEACVQEGEAVTGEDIVKKWYEEVHNYDFSFDDQTDQPGTEHFTQIVWKNSTELGIGRSMDTHKNKICTFTVAVYRKPGNEKMPGNPGFWKENVPMPTLPEKR